MNFIKTKYRDKFVLNSPEECYDLYNNNNCKNEIEIVDDFDDTS